MTAVSKRWPPEFTAGGRTNACYSQRPSWMQRQSCVYWPKLHISLGSILKVIRFRQTIWNISVFSPSLRFYTCLFERERRGCRSLPEKTEISWLKVLYTQLSTKVIFSCGLQVEFNGGVDLEPSRIIVLHFGIYVKSRRGAHLRRIIIYAESEGNGLYIFYLDGVGHASPS
jgi:hypothetical protein